MSRKCSVTYESKPCEKCSFATCDGCHQPFCLPHLNSHQQELAAQMEVLVHDHDLLREELSEHRIYSEYTTPDFAYEFTVIDAWRTRTLAQVKKLVNAEAERARNVVRLVMDENRHRVYDYGVAISQEFDQLKKRLAQLTEQLQTRIETMDYSELDLLQWQTQLRDIKYSSLKPQVPTHEIIGKLSVRETRDIHIDVSNILDVVYKDEVRTKAPSTLDSINDFLDTTIQSDLTIYNHTSRRHTETWNNDETEHVSRKAYERPSVIKSFSDNNLRDDLESAYDRPRSAKSGDEVTSTKQTKC